MKRAFLAVNVFVVLLFFAWRESESQGGYAFRIRPLPALPAVCQPGNGDVVYLTAGGAGLAPALYSCTAANTWTRLILNNTPLFSMTGVGPGGFTVTGAGQAPARFVTSGDEGIASFTRSDAGHAHIFVASTLNGMDLGLGGAGEIHLDSTGVFEINIRRAGADEWVYGVDNTFRWVNGTAFGALAAQPNGTITYCPDCTIAAPCAGGGTGALAKRLNGAWVCN